MKDMNRMKKSLCSSIKRGVVMEVYTHGKCAETEVVR